MNQYFIEYLGTLVVVSAKLVTEADPVVMGITFFAVYWMTKGITRGLFTPFGPLALYMLGRMGFEEASKNLLVQSLGAISAVLIYKPFSAFIQDF
jgi:glycerol uptake facilitator-like aquaporin